jgi:hypothetical protein
MNETQAQKEHDGNPRFGRLLLVLVAAVILVAIITFASEAMYS